MKINFIRVLLSIASNKNWSFWLFLHGDDLHEEVHMMLPLGFKIPGSEDMVCRLKKTLYGLKQYPRAWFGRFSGSLKKVGYRQSQTDHTLFIKHT